MLWRFTAMRLYLLFISLLVIIAYSCKNNSGCTDPNAPNYNPSAIESNAEKCGYPPEEKKVLLAYFNNTQNSNCGSYGLPLLADVDAAFGSNVIPIIAHPSTSDPLFSDASVDLSGFLDVSGYPDFVVNGTSGLLVENTIKDTINATLALNGKAGLLIESQIQDTTITGVIYVKFYGKYTGDFYVAGYLLEDNISTNQAGSGSIILNNVVRASTYNNGLGEEIFSGTTNNILSYKINFSIQLDASWNKSNLKMIAVLWNKPDNEPATPVNITIQ